MRIIEQNESLLEYKAWMWNLATVPAWSDLIHVILWRNDGFLHSYCNFSKSNAFSENFVRTKFILHKIFFLMSILSSRKTSRMLFNLCWKNCEKQFVWGHDHFEGKGCLATKINTNFFERNEVLNIFHITIFKKNLNNHKKFWGARPYFREWVSDYKN